MKKLDGNRVDGQRGSEKETEMVVDYGDKDGSRRWIVNKDMNRNHLLKMEAGDE